MAAACQAEGVAVEWLGADGAERRWPGMRFASPVLLQPGGGRIRAADALEALRAQAVAAGAELREDELVIQLVPDGEWVRVITEPGAFVAPVAVVTAGAWSGPLLFGHVDLPLLTTTCERVAFFEPRDGAEPWPSFIHRDAISHYGLPGPYGLVKLGEHHTGPVTTGDTRSFEVDPPALADLSDYAAEWLPGLDPVPVDATTCLYTSTPTEDFVLDRSGPIVVGAGFSGHGFKFVPEIGRLLAAMAVGEPRPREPVHAGARSAGWGARDRRAIADGARAGRWPAGRRRSPRARAQGVAGDDGPLPPRRAGDEVVVGVSHRGGEDRRRRASTITTASVASTATNGRSHTRYWGDSTGARTSTAPTAASRARSGAEPSGRRAASHQAAAMAASVASPSRAPTPAGSVPMRQAPPSARTGPPVAT